MLRVPEHEQRRHKLTINLTDAEHDVLMAEAEARQLVPSVVARECFAQGLRRFTQQAEEPAPAVKPADRIPQPRTRQPGTRTPAAVIKQRQAEHDALCLPYLRAATGPKDAMQRLEQAGIPSPSGRKEWRKEAVWRICKRHGISSQPIN